MNLYESLQFANEKSHVIRERKNLLYTFGTTRLPYVCLSESPQDQGDIVIRQGQVSAEPPKIAFPGEQISFEGFEFGEEHNSRDQEMIQILIARRINMPPAKYTNKSEATTTERNSMEGAVEKAVNNLDRQNDSRTAVITAPDAVWNLSILLYVGQQVARSAPANVAEHLEHRKFQGHG